MPAHDEAEHLPGCLAALAVAAARVDVPVCLVVALDACRDASAAVLSEAGVRGVRLEARNVGAARHTAAVAALDGLTCDHPDRSVWLATTDADTIVPPDWLVRHLDHAAAGADLVAGTVDVLDWTRWPVTLPPRYGARYARSDRHVHGANLGVRASVYAQLGGFPPLVDGEDVALVAAAVAAGHDVRHPADLPVSTSARPHGRVPAGFHGHLRALAAGLDGPL